MEWLDFWDCKRFEVWSFFKFRDLLHEKNDNYNSRVKWEGAIILRVQFRIYANSYFIKVLSKLDLGRRNGYQYYATTYLHSKIMTSSQKMPLERSTLIKMRGKNKKWWDNKDQVTFIMRKWPKFMNLC